MTPDTRSEPRGPRWWRGERGEWLVAGQIVLMLLVLLGPRHLPGAPAAPIFSGHVAFFSGCVLILSGTGLFLAAILRLGPALTPLPYPKADAPLVQSGPFALVRHPIYSGGLAVSAGIALATDGWLTWLYVAALFLLLDVKSRREETWLVGKFPDYRAYRRRVRKLIPFVY
jgi:protein-S-isoprenylcysteine O-methyltransferase Ste14